MSVGFQMPDATTMESLAYRLLGIKLDENQRRFLDAIKAGVCVHMTQETMNNVAFRELVELLHDMHKKGHIPSFEIILVPNSQA